MSAVSVSSLAHTYRHVGRQRLVAALDPLVADDALVVGAGVAVERDGALRQTDDDVRAGVRLGRVVNL